MRHADEVERLNEAIAKHCKVVADEVVAKIRNIEPTVTFGYCRPELGRPQKRYGLLNKAMEGTREQIRSAFGLPKDSAGE